jgi:hypothetical protein
MGDVRAALDVLLGFGSYLPPCSDDPRMPRVHDSISNEED